MRQQKYFVLHAPRQTGKTSCLLALRDYLNAEQRYWAVYTNVEAGQAMRDNVELVERIVVSTIANEASLILGSDLSIRVLSDTLLQVSTGNVLTTYLMNLCMALDRPQAFPQTIILCGVRDVRDYRIQMSGKDIVTGGSAFNIKSESLRLGNFSREEIHNLYLQHTAATGQEFDDACFPMIWEATEGQPWLVNALGYEVTEKMRENRDRSIRIIPEMIFRRMCHPAF